MNPLALRTARPEDWWAFFDRSLFHCHQAESLRVYELFLAEIAPFSYSHQLNYLIAVGTASSLLQPHCYALLMKKMPAFCHEKGVIFETDWAIFFLKLEFLACMFALRIYTKSRRIFRISKGLNHNMMILARLMMSNFSGWIVSIKYPKISSPNHIYNCEQATQTKGYSNSDAND